MPSSSLNLAAAPFSLGLDARRAPGPQFDFSTGALPPGATLSRAGPAACIGADRRLAVLPADVARFEHDPASGRRLGLLVEPAATNRALHASDVADPVWLTYNGVVRVGRVAGAAPDGGDATRIAFGTAGGADIAAASALYQEPALPDTGDGWTASFWIRAVAGETSVRLGLYPGYLPVVSSGDLAVTADRWTRASISAAAVLTGANFSVRNDAAGSSGDILVWGAQFETGARPTSGIETDAAASTRAADRLSLDWSRLGVRDGPAMLRLFFAPGAEAGAAIEDVAVTIAGGVADVPPRSRPLVAVRLA